MLKSNRYIIKKNSYMIDLDNVDFITWKENVEEEGTYWTKFHMGSKEARYICQSVGDLKTILTKWTELKGKASNLNVEEIVEW